LNRNVGSRRLDVDETTSIRPPKSALRQVSWKHAANAHPGMPPPLPRKDSRTKRHAGLSYAGHLRSCYVWQTSGSSSVNGKETVSCRASVCVVCISDNSRLRVQVTEFVNTGRLLGTYHRVNGCIGKSSLGDCKLFASIHSSRSRIIGSTARARRAGTKAATTPTQSIVRMTPPRMTGSFGVA
jgi:hypothetical protein